MYSRQCLFLRIFVSFGNSGRFYGVDFYVCDQQIRIGGVQRTVVACAGCEYQGSVVLLTSACTGAHASLPCDGSSRLTHTLSLCSAVCAPLSRTPYRIVTRGFTRATDFLCPFTYTMLVRYLERKRLSRYRVRSFSTTCKENRVFFSLGV